MLKYSNVCIKFEVFDYKLSNVDQITLIPFSNIVFGYILVFWLDFMKPEHDQYIYRHANGYESSK